MTFKKGDIVMDIWHGKEVYVVLSHADMNNRVPVKLIQTGDQGYIHQSFLRKKVMDDIDEYKIVMEYIGEHMTATVVMNGKVQARGVPVITKEWYESQYGELK